MEWHLAGAGALVVVLIGASVFGGLRAQQAAEPPRLTHPDGSPTTLRIAPLDPAKWTDEQREILSAQSLASGSREPKPESAHTMIKVCIHQPQLCDKWQGLMWYFVFDKSQTLPERDKELLILRTAWHRKGDYIWAAHVRSGMRAGLTQDDIDRIPRGPEAPGWNAWDRTLLRAADELHTKTFIEDATWKALDERYDEGQLVEAVMLVGNYTQVAMYQKTIGIPLGRGSVGVQYLQK